MTLRSRFICPCELLLLARSSRHTESALDSVRVGSSWGELLLDFLRDRFADGLRAGFDAERLAARRALRTIRIAQQSVEQRGRVSIATVFVEAERGDQQAAFADARLQRESRVLVQPSEGDAAQHVVKMFRQHAFQQVQRDNARRFESEDGGEPYILERSAVAAYPVEVREPAAIKLGTRAQLHPQVRAAAKRVLGVRQQDGRTSPLQVSD